MKLDNMPEPPSLGPLSDLVRARARFLAENRERTHALAEQGRDRLRYVSKLQAWAEKLVDKARSVSTPDLLYAFAKDLELREMRRAEEYAPHLKSFAEQLEFVERDHGSWAKPWQDVLRTWIEALTSELETLRDTRLRLIMVGADMINRTAEDGPVFSSGRDAAAYLASLRKK